MPFDCLSSDAAATALLAAAIEPKQAVWLAAVPVLGLALWGSLFGGQRWRLDRLAYGATALYVLLCLALIAKGVVSPGEWDFKHFWSWGVAAAEGTNPYDHENLLRIIEPVGAGDELRQELYCFYPPPSLLLFAPLGLAPFKAALLAWSVVQALALVACVWLLLKEFAPDGGPVDRGALVLLVVSSWATSATFAFSQSNFLVLLAVLLFWRDRDRPVAGLWMALGALVKPLAAALGLYLLVRGSWRALAVAVATGLALVAATWLVLGPGVFTAFAEQQGVSEHYLPAQDLNQSLSAVLLRATGDQTTSVGLLERPLLLAALGAVVLATAAVVWLSRGTRGRHALAAVLAMMLLAYPGSLAHYGVLLLPAIAWLVAESRRTGRGRWPVMTVAVVSAACIAVKATFVASALVWVVACAAAMAAAPADAPDEPATGEGG